MMSKLLSVWFVLGMVSLAWAGDESPTIEIDASIVRRFEELSSLYKEAGLAKEVEQAAIAKVKAEPKDAPKDEALRQAVVDAKVAAKTKNAAYEKAAYDKEFAGTVAVWARQVVAANPKDGTISVLQARDKYPTKGAVEGFLSGLLTATNPENALEVRAAVETYCAEHGGSQAADWAVKSLYWKTGADPLQTLQSLKLARSLREQAFKRYAGKRISEFQGVITVQTLEEAVASVPEDFRDAMKRAIIAKPQLVPGTDQKDAYLAFIADHPNKADLKLAFFLKNKSAPDVKQLIQDRITPTLSTYDKDLGAANKLRLLSAADILELDAIAQGKAANLVPAIVLRHTTYGDPVRMTVLKAQAYVDECKFILRATDGRVTRDSVRAVVDRIMDGKGTLAIPSSNTAKEFGAQLPAKTFPALMFQGEFAAAAQLAYAQINESKSDTDYLQAVARLRQAVQCLDRCYNGRSLELVKWLNGDLGTCPVPEIVK